ncbi:MAG: alpha/beta fold hydrolase [Flavobacteriales bacterium]|nr:alpha/beta fold hydrolase [Flavobacteriales bacterium]
MDLYLLPGLSADHRLFHRLELGQHRMICLEHPELSKGDRISDIAARHMEAIDRTTPHAFIGVSMGGMIAQEMAAMAPPTRLILISTWKGPQEMPRHVLALRGTHPERMITPFLMGRVAPLMRMLRWQLGLTDRSTEELVQAMMRSFPLSQLQRQVDAALNWDGPGTAVAVDAHIHGTRDRLMPIALIADPIPVQGGGHVMVIDRAREIGRMVLGILREA